MYRVRCNMSKSLHVPVPVLLNSFSNTLRVNSLKCTCIICKVPRQNVRRKNVWKINVRRKNVLRHNGRRHNTRGTKRLEEQNVRKDTMSERLKHPEEENVRKTKHPWGQHFRRDKTSRDKILWLIFIKATY